jgi:hypothetical protein
LKILTSTLRFVQLAPAKFIGIETAKFDGTEHGGPHLLEGEDAHVSPRRPAALALILARILERLGVRYCIGGSVASSVYGEVRTTLDVDVNDRAGFPLC